MQAPPYSWLVWRGSSNNVPHSVVLHPQNIWKWPETAQVWPSVIFSLFARYRISRKIPPRFFAFSRGILLSIPLIFNTLLKPQEETQVSHAARWNLCFYLQFQQFLNSSDIFWTVFKLHVSIYKYCTKDVKLEGVLRYKKRWKNNNN